MAKRTSGNSKSGGGAGDGKRTLAGGAASGDDNSKARSFPIIDRGLRTFGDLQEFSLRMVEDVYLGNVGVKRARGTSRWVRHVLQEYMLQLKAEERLLLGNPPNITGPDDAGE